MFFIGPHLSLSAPLFICLPNRHGTVPDSALPTFSTSVSILWLFNSRWLQANVLPRRGNSVIWHVIQEKLLQMQTRDVLMRCNVLICSFAVWELLLFVLVKSLGIKTLCTFNCSKNSSRLTLKKMCCCTALHNIPLTSPDFKYIAV